MWCTVHSVRICYNAGAYSDEWLLRFPPGMASWFHVRTIEPPNDVEVLLQLPILFISASSACSLALQQGIDVDPELHDPTSVAPAAVAT
jgi:hypothetical protein